MKAGASNKRFDSFEDLRQTGMRLEVIRYLALVVFLVLGVRLWYLQVMNHEVYAEQADQNRYRMLPIPARRGTVYDRNGKVLVDSRSSYNIVLDRKSIKSFADELEILANNLDIERDWLEQRFEDAKLEPKYESIVVREAASAKDVAWVAAHQYDYPELSVQEAPQRRYIYGKLAAHALGYVGEVSKDELNKQGGLFTKEKGYRLGDIVGKFGIERTYNELLTGHDGWRKVIVDSRGRIQREVERVEPVPGRDLYTTLDLELQQAAEAQGDTMPAGRGAIAFMNPNTGEILAMMSRPAFDPNTFSQRAKTDEGKGEILEYYKDEDRPLYNRVIQGQFPPGSTWKLMTTVAALNERVITPESSRVQDGGLQIGNYYMSSMSHLGQPDIHTAIVHSADGYFYRLGLKMGVERFEKWVHIFRFGEKTGIDLPHEYAGIAPTRETKLKSYQWQIKKAQKEADEAPPKEKPIHLFRVKQLQAEAEWKDYDMASSAFGQGQNASTPIQLLRYVGGLANGGTMHTPHLLLRSASGMDRQGQLHPETRYEDKNVYQVPMSPEIHKVVKDGMWGAVNEGGGTAGAARIEGFDVSGKTGTAQVAAKSRAGTESKDHAWFIAFAPRDKAEICSVILTENAGFGGKQSAPRAKAIYEVYYRRTRNLPPEDPAQVARK